MSTIPADTPRAPGADPRTEHAPRVYRGALADARGKIIGGALAAWLIAHIVMGGLIARRLENAEIFGLPPVQRPDTPVWFHAPELQVGIQAFERLGSSMLHSMAWQILALACFSVALVVILTARLRVIVSLVPPALFLLTALFQLIAYAVYSPYWAQGNAIFTLAFAGIACGTTWALAPRNSGLTDLRRILAGLGRQCVTNPVALVLGPIFAKDVRVLGRHRGTYLLRAVYPLVLLTLLGLFYFGATKNINSNTSGAERVQQLQEIAPGLALFIAWTQYIFLLIVAASLTAPSVCDERRTRTLGSLMTTPMSAAQIVLGKLSSRLVQLLIFGLISLPFLLGIRVFGGLDSDTIIALVAVSISSTLVMAAVGTLASTWARRPAGAVAMAFALFLLVSFIPAILVIVSSLSSGGRPPEEGFALSGPMAMMIISASATSAGALPIAIHDLWIANAIVNLVIAIGAVFLASVSLRGVMLSERALEAPKRSSRRSRRAAPAAVHSETAPTNTQDAANAEVFVERDTAVSDNPVLWRELRQPVLGSRRMMILATCIVGVLLLWMYSEVSPTRGDPHAVVAVIGMVILTLQAAVVSTGAITSEKDSSTWLTLLTTPLSGSQILFPKVFGSVKKLWYFSALVGAELAFGVLLGAVHPVLPVHLAIIILATGAFLGGTGVFFSLVARRSSSATLYNILLAGFLWIGLPILSSVIEEFFLPRGMLRGERLLAGALHINPIALAFATIEASTRHSGGWSASLPARSNYNVVEFTVVLLVVGTLAAAAGLGCVRFATSRFNRLAGRTS